MVITSKSNNLIKDIIKLQSDKKYRKSAKAYVVEGIKPVRECISAGCDVKLVVCSENCAEAFDGAQLVSESVFCAMSTEKTPQGALAVVGLPENGIKPPKGSCLLLDRLQDPGNIGTIVRTANAAGYGEIYAINCADPYSPKAVRASMSGIFFVTVYSGAEEEILGALGGVPLICADMSGEDIFSFAPPEKYCLCIGSEGSGISPQILNKAAYTVKIPMRDSCESLNAGVSAGIAMYQLKNKLRG